MVLEGIDDAAPLWFVDGINNKGHWDETAFPGCLLRGAIFLEPMPAGE